MSTIEKVKEEVSVEELLGFNNEIVLYNDDVNTFDHVIETLMRVCEHTAVCVQGRIRKLVFVKMSWPTLRSHVAHEQHRQMLNLRVERMAQRLQRQVVDVLRRECSHQVVALRCSSMFEGHLRQSV